MIARLTALVSALSAAGLAFPTPAANAPRVVQSTSTYRQASATPGPKQHESSRPALALRTGTKPYS